MVATGPNMTSIFGHDHMCVVLQAARTIMSPDVMTVHPDTTCESARCLHADGFHNHTSNGLSHATNERMTKSKAESNSNHAHAHNKQMHVNSLVRVANPPTVYVRATQDERHARLPPEVTNLSKCSSGVLQATPHIVGLIT